jgi:hypothetical protein
MQWMKAGGVFDGIYGMNGIGRKRDRQRGASPRFLIHHEGHEAHEGGLCKMGERGKGKTGAWEHGRVENEERAFRDAGILPAFTIRMGTGQPPVPHLFLITGGTPVPRFEHEQEHEHEHGKTRATLESRNAASYSRSGGPTHFSPARQGREPVSPRGIPIVITGRKPVPRKPFVFFVPFVVNKEFENGTGSGVPAPGLMLPVAGGRSHPPRRSIRALGGNPGCSASHDKISPENTT